jgi:hypothetical protein
VLRDRVVERLAWVGALVTLVTAAILLFGPLWDSAVGENPLERDPDPDIMAVLRLAMPTVIVMAAVVVAVCAGRWRIAGVVALLLMGVAVWLAPSPLPLWFLPGLVVTAAGYAVALRPRGRALQQEPVRAG